MYFFVVVSFYYLSTFLQYCLPILLTVTTIIFQFFIWMLFYNNATSFLALVVGVKIWKVVLTSCNAVFNQSKFNRDVKCYFFFFLKKIYFKTCDKQASCARFQFNFYWINLYCIYIREKKCLTVLITLACDMT